MILSKYAEFSCLLRKPPMFIWPWKIQFWDFFHENLHACIVFIYKNKELKNWVIFRFWKKKVFFFLDVFFLFLDDRENPIFQKKNFAAMQLIRRRQKLTKYNFFMKKSQKLDFSWPRNNVSKTNFFVPQLKK